MGAFADVEVVLDIDAEAREGVDLPDQLRRVDHQTVADDRLLAPHDAARDQGQNVLLIADIDGVSGVVSALVADDDIESFGEKVHHLAFSLIAPLGS